MADMAFQGLNSKICKNMVFTEYLNGHVFIIILDVKIDFGSRVRFYELFIFFILNKYIFQLYFFLFNLNRFMGLSFLVIFLLIDSYIDKLKLLKNQLFLKRVDYPIDIF